VGAADDVEPIPVTPVFRRVWSDAREWSGYYYSMWASWRHNGRKHAHWGIVKWASDMVSRNPLQNHYHPLGVTVWQLFKRVSSKFHVINCPIITAAFSAALLPDRIVRVTKRVGSTPVMRFHHITASAWTLPWKAHILANTGTDPPIGDTNRSPDVHPPMLPVASASDLYPMMPIP
jgi:hypothetical protein